MYSTFKYGNIINILLTLLSIVPVIKSFGHKKGHKKSHMQSKIRGGFISYQSWPIINPKIK